MGKRIPITIRGVGAYVPERVVLNEELSAFCDVTDEWVRVRTGIRERRIAREDENSMTMAYEASVDALQDAGMDASEIDLIIIATSTPLTLLPSTACFLQHRLGCRPIPAFDLSAACSGFVYGVITAAHMMIGAGYKNALILGSEKMSTVSNYEDRASGILLGDGAGAAILTVADNDEAGIYHHEMAAEGEGAEFVWIPAGGSLMPPSEKTVAENLHTLKMNGREVYKYVVQKMQEVVERTLDKGGISMDELTLIVPHQSNLRIIESVMEKLSIPAEKMAVNIDRYGNTSAASVPLALHEAWREGRVKRGDWVLLAGFGGGMTWASALVKV